MRSVGLKGRGLKSRTGLKGSGEVEKRLSGG
jgi:hypothetical protein